MNKLRTLVSLLLLALLASPLAISTTKITYKKGETIQIAGFSNTTNATLARVKIFFENYTIYDGSAELNRSRFSLNYTTTPLDPSGAWRVDVEAGGESAEKNITVSHSPESAFYLARILSPSPISYSRTEKIEIRVMVTDADVPVSGARADAFLFGERFALAEEEIGVYSSGKTIPHNLSLGSRAIRVTAMKTTENKTYGGEGAGTFTVEPARIITGFIEPHEEILAQGQSMEIKMELHYSSGAIVRNPLINARANFEEIIFECAENICSASFSGAREGVVDFFVDVKDDAGNSGSATKTITFRASQVNLILQSAVPVFLFLVLLTALLFALRARRRKDARESERKEILALIKKLQEDYFEKGKGNRRSYERRLSEYKERLARLEKK
ncbi:MAG: hypothetical protein AB1468_04295 [Candidatus Micrarchaeota archaeon]